MGGGSPGCNWSALLVASSCSSRGGAAAAARKAWHSPAPWPPLPGLCCSFDDEEWSLRKQKKPKKKKGQQQQQQQQVGAGRVGRLVPAGPLPLQHMHASIAVDSCSTCSWSGFAGELTHSALCSCRAAARRAAAAAARKRSRNSSRKNSSSSSSSRRSGSRRAAAGRAAAAAQARRRGTTESPAGAHSYQSQAVFCTRLAPLW